MITPFKARVFIASLLLACFAPLAALAQDVSVDINTTKSPAVAGKAAPDGIVQFDVLVTATGGDNGNVVVSLGALPSGVAYDSQVAGLHSVYDPNNNEVLISTIADTVIDGVLINFSADNSAAAGSYSLAATITAADSNTDTTNDTDSDTFDITRESDLSMDKSAPATVVAGTNLTYTLTVANAGPSDLDQAGVADLLPAGTSYVSSTNATCDEPVVGIINCLTGPIADGGNTSFDIVVSVPSSAVQGAVLTNNADVDASVGSSTDPVVENDTDSAVTTVEREVALGLSADGTADPVLAGSGAGNAAVTFDFDNLTGPSDASGAQVVLDPLPSGVTIDTATPGVGTFDMGTMTWTIGDAPLNFTASLALVLTVDYTVPSGDFDVSGTATATETVTNAPVTAAHTISVEVASDYTVRFNTSIDFLDGDAAIVTATLTCNAGLPLSQSFDISDGSPVNFTMTELPFTTPGTMCEITVDGLDSAYSLAPASCLFETDTGTFGLDGNNVCAFVASGNPATYTVSKVWNVSDGVTEEVVYDVDVTISCDDEILTVGGAPHNGSDTAMVTLGDGDSVVVTVDASAGTQCSATEDLQQSFVEQEASEDCTDADLAAGGSASCTFTNTAFYEGIPTLSQYGLAALILLMLGVGFVGIRRYV